MTARNAINSPSAAVDELSSDFGGVRGALCAGAQLLCYLGETPGCNAASCNAVSWLLFDAVERLDECARVLEPLAYGRAPGCGEAAEGKDAPPSVPPGRSWAPDDEGEACGEGALSDAVSDALDGMACALAMLRAMHEDETGSRMVTLDYDPDRDRLTIGAMNALDAATCALQTATRTGR